jgi:hypothetical protein
VRKPIREVKIDSAADLEALPEGEWFYVPGGIHVPLVFDNLITIDGVDYVPLPPNLLVRVWETFVEKIRWSRRRRIAERTA